MRPHSLEILIKTTITRRKPLRSFKILMFPPVFCPFVVVQSVGSPSCKALRKRKKLQEKKRENPSDLWISWYFLQAWPRFLCLLPSAEPVRPIDPAAWISHTTAMTGAYPRYGMSPSMSITTSTSSSLTSSIPESESKSPPGQPPGQGAAWGPPGPGLGATKA